MRTNGRKSRRASRKHRRMAVLGILLALLLCLLPSPVTPSPIGWAHRTGRATWRTPQARRTQLMPSPLTHSIRSRTVRTIQADTAGQTRSVLSGAFDEHQPACSRWTTKRADSGLPSGPAAGYIPIFPVYRLAQAPELEAFGLGSDFGGGLRGGGFSGGQGGGGNNRVASSSTGSSASGLAGGSGNSPNHTSRF